MIGTVIYVEWIDAGIVAARWTDQSEALGQAGTMIEGSIRSAGFLLEQTPERIVIAGSMNPNNDDVSLVFVIPMACVRSWSIWTAAVGEEPAP